MIPTEEELIKFIKSKDLPNFSLIAKHFKIKNNTVSDLIQKLEYKNLVEVSYIGGSKIVRLKESINKRGQVTLYVILGLVVLIALVFVFSLQKYIIKTSFEREAESIQVLEEFKPVKNYLDSCIQHITVEGAQLLGSQGGYIDVPNDGLPVNPIIPFSNRLDLFNNERLLVPYWFYETANGIQKTQIPNKVEMQNQLADYLNLNLNTCLDNFTAFEGYDFSRLNAIKTEIQIEDEKILVKVDSDFEISKAGLTTKFDKFLVSVDIPLGELYKTASDIFDKSNKNNFFEEKTIDMMILYDEIPYSKTEFSCERKIWGEEQVKRDFRRIVNRNIAAIKLSNSPSTTDYFTLSSADQSIGANFLYSEDWPFFIEIFPSENGILKGDDIVKKTGALRAISSLFCLNNYHFVYDVKYPILITLTKNNYNFQFANMVIINNNQPKENIEGTLNLQESFDICGKRLTKVKVNTFAVDDNLNVVPLEDVDISFKCFTNTCSIGKTIAKNGESVLEDNFPQCINGQVIGEKDGYNKGTLIISTNEESQTSLILEKLYNKELEINLINKNSGSIRDLAKDEQLLIKFESLDDAYTTIINYPEENSISLIPGNYKITTYILKQSSGGIKIKGESIENCISVPKGGLLGLFFDEIKCVTSNFDDFVLDQAIVGGVEFESEINRNSLINSNKLVLYTIFDKAPQNNNEILQIYDSISTNKDNQYFKYPEFRR